VSATVAALEDSYTDADLFEKIVRFVETKWMVLALMN
jgi:hypothetical protein